jgi:hypothetical protein
VTDTGSGPDARQYRWTATLDINGLEIPEGGIEVIAIGVDTDPVTPVTYHTPAVNGNITVVDGTIGGED